MPKRAAANSKTVAVLFLLMIGLPWSVSHAATAAYADPNLACAGLTPCFGTIQEAVNNAGPEPAEVGIFPGVYAESVDLSLMGSAIAGNPGDITLQALDAAGQAIDSGVVIDPAATGGPGIGFGLTTGTMASFEGDLSLTGLSITSPDSSALGVLLIGDLTIVDLVAQNAAETGIAGVVDGNVNLTRVNASMNGESGVILSATGSAIVNEIQASQNTLEGIFLVVSENLFIQTAEASENENGAQFLVCLEADIRDVTTSRNLANGTVVSFGPNDCQPATPAAAFDFLQDIDVEVLSNSLATARGSAIAGSLFAENIVSEDNGVAGVGIRSTTGIARLDGLFAYDNLGIGLFLQTPQAEWNMGEAIGNETGILVITDQLSMAQIVANDSQSMMPSLPSRGAGVLVAARSAILSDIQADNNPLVGLVLSDPMDGSIPDYTIINSQFEDNLIGILSQSSRVEDPVILMDLILDAVDLSGNQDAGLSISGLENGAFSNVSVSRSEIGMDVTVTGQLQVETSDIVANTTGMLMQIEPGGSASVACSNFSQNAVDGVEMIQGTSLAATTNYWGDASGPTHPGNPGGIGDRVTDAANGGVGTINYAPFLSQPATEADCPRALPQTVPVPVFSSTGIIFLLIGMLFTLWLSKRRSALA